MVGRPPAIYGLDLSSTCTGICLPDGTTDHYQPKGALLERAVATRNWVRDYLAPGVDLVVVEAIGTNRVNTAIAIAYVHAFVDQLIADNDLPAIKVAPSALKKWATSKSNADKHAMTVTAIRNGWACDSDEGTTDDEADAWHLWTIGRALVSQPVVETTAYRADVLDKIG